LEKDLNELTEDRARRTQILVSLENDLKTVELNITRVNENMHALNRRTQGLSKYLERGGQIQEQLLKAQKLAVIGELAGMVGHDLRNPLTSISGAQYYLKRRLSLEGDGKIKEMLSLIEKNITYQTRS
jgi:signal transduction histidine kinase